MEGDCGGDALEGSIDGWKMMRRVVRITRKGIVVGLLAGSDDVDGRLRIGDIKALYMQENGTGSYRKVGT